MCWMYRAQNRHQFPSLLTLYVMNISGSRTCMWLSDNQARGTALPLSVTQLQTRTEVGLPCLMEYNLYFIQYGSTPLAF